MSGQNQQPEEVKNYFLAALYELGKYICHFDVNGIEVTEVIKSIDGERLEYLGVSEEKVGDIKQVLQISFAESVEEQAQIEAFRGVLDMLFVLNYTTYSPPLQSKALQSKKALDIEVAAYSEGERLIDTLSVLLTKSFIESSDFDLDTLSEKKIRCRVGMKTILFPSDAEAIVEFLTLIKTLNPDLQKSLVQQFKKAISLESDISLSVHKREELVGDLTKSVVAVIAIQEVLRAEKRKPEYIAERNKLALAFPSLVKKYDLKKKEPKPAKTSNVPSLQVVQPVAAAEVQKSKPAALSINAATVVRTFETKFYGLMGRLRDKPSDKRFDEISVDDKWKNYRNQRGPINDLINSRKATDYITSSRQLALLTDFLAYNFGGEVGDKKQFFMHGVLALAIKDLAQKGIAIEEGHIAKTVSMLGLNGDLAKMKLTKFNAQTFLEKLTELPPSQDKSSTRECGVAMLIAGAKGDEKLVVAIKTNLELATTANSPQARQQALRSVREIGQSERGHAA